MTRKILRDKYVQTTTRTAEKGVQGGGIQAPGLPKLQGLRTAWAAAAA